MNPTIELPVFRNLMQVAMMGATLGMRQAAELICVGGAAAQPDLPEPSFGLATVWLLQGRHEKAVALCEKMLIEHPGNVVAKSIAAMVFHQSGKEGWVPLTLAVMSAAEDAPHLAAAKDILRGADLAQLAQTAAVGNELPVGFTRC